MPMKPAILAASVGMERKIEIVKFPGSYRGRQAVIVDGERWAIIHTSGGVPAKYWFQQIGHSGAVREMRGRVLQTVHVFGERHKRRSRFTDLTAPAEPPKPPISERLLAEAKRLVKIGLITSPAVAQKGIADKQARDAAARKKREDDEYAIWSAKVRDALGGMEQYVKMGIPPAVKDENVAAIVELMKWAQSQ